MITIPTATQLSDSDLLSAAARVAAEGRQHTADLIALLVVVDERHLYAAGGYTSLFAFCVGALRLSEDETFYRVAAARVALCFPVVLDCLRDGRLTLTAVALLRSVLTEENHERLLVAAEGRSKREVQQLVATVAPRPDVATTIRKLPAPRGVEAAAEDRARPAEPDAGAAVSRNDGGAGDQPLFGPAPGNCPEAPRSPVEAHLHAAALSVGISGPEAHLPPDSAVTPSPFAGAAPLRPAEIRPLTPTRYSLRLTISEETHAKLQRAHDLLARSVAPGDFAAVIDRALTLLIAQVEGVRFAARQPRPEPRPELRTKERTPRRKVEERHPTASVTSGAPLPEVATPVGSGEGNGTRRKARYIPAAVRREVWARDGARCAFVSRDGKRCGATRYLEFHHRKPFADGGAAAVSNVTLLCTRHNSWEAERWFGEEVTEYRGGDKTARVGTRVVPSPVLARVDSCRDPDAQDETSGQARQPIARSRLE